MERNQHKNLTSSIQGQLYPKHPILSIFFSKMLIRCTHPAPCPAAVSPASDVRDRAMITERECAACKALLRRKYGIPKRAAAIAPVFAGRDAIGCASGGRDGLLSVLVAFAAVGYGTGIMCAVVDKKLSSAVGFKGICKKVLILMLVGVANTIDVHIVGNSGALRGAVTCFYLSNQGLSVLENAAHLGLPIPEPLKNALVQLHGRNDGD